MSARWRLLLPVPGDDTDDELERRIDETRRRLLVEPNRLALWNELAALIKQRSPKQVSRMERAQGLL